MVVLRAELNNDHPFVIENGAAVCIPCDYFNKMPEDVIERDGYYIKEFVSSRKHWQKVLQGPELHLNDAFLTFQQAGIDKIMELTGLSIDQAHLASERQYGEPLKWLGSAQEFDIFKEYIASKGGYLLEGGRFIHLSGRCDKGHALKWLLNVYRSQLVDHECISIALGDSQNDIAMLKAADYGILIRSPAHEFPGTEDIIYKTKAFGPKGWVEGVSQIFKEIKIKLD